MSPLASPASALTRARATAGALLEGARAERNRAPLLVALLVTLLGVNLTGVGFCVLVAWRRELRALVGRYRGLGEETVELSSEAAARAPPQASGEGREGTSKPAAEAEGEAEGEAVIL